jgi:hypothetical protein
MVSMRKSRGRREPLNEAAAPKPEMIRMVVVFLTALHTICLLAVTLACSLEVHREYLI